MRILRVEKRLEEACVKDERKTKKELIAELEESRRENAELRQQGTEGGDTSAVQLQLAIERVRSEAMAMKTSGELMDVVTVLHTEMVRVGVQSQSCNIGFISDDAKIFTNYLTTTFPSVIEYFLSNPDPGWDQYLDTVDGVRRLSAVHIGDILDPDENSLMESALKAWQEQKPDITPLRNEYVYNIPFEFGIIGLRETTVRESTITIVQELAKALSLGYLRFLDFQQLEEQAEQARRERAVERVRAEAMAMKASDDLHNVVAVIHQELFRLTDAPCWSNIYFIDEEADLVVQYLASSKISGTSKMQPNWRAFNEHIATAELRSVYGENEWAREYFNLKEPKLAQGNMTVEMLTSISERLDNEVTPEMIDYIVGDHYSYGHPFEYGLIEYGLRAKITDDLVKLIGEFSGALSLGFLRFLDFQKLEEQAEQARRERAVERVRAEAMAMRSSDDLLKVAAVVHQELNHLGIDTSVASIILIDRDRDYIITYRAMISPEKHGLPWSSSSSSEWITHGNGKETIAHVQEQGSFGELMEGEFMNKVVEAWDKGDVSLHPWDLGRDKKHKAKIGSICREHLGMADADAALYINEFRERLAGKDIVNIPFEYGMIGIMQKGRNQHQEDTVKELAQAFSLGYLRFLDFQKVDQAQKSLIDELEEELQTAHTLQMGLMPTESPQIDGINIAGRCLPASQVGGDFFQYFQQDGKLSVCMADVTGHAMEAAVPVMMFSGVLHSQMEDGHSIERLFSRLNKTMNATLDKRTYVCFEMIELDLAERKLQLANSGCPYPYHYHASTGDVTELQVDAYPLGVRAETAYTAIETSLEMGDYIVFCSDGIIETTNAQEDMFGFEQTAEAIQKACAEGLSAEALIDRLIGLVQEFAGDEPQGDDMTCVVLRVEA
jgi:serine phosphatase RsbU (regulator of sigma subunit)